VSARVRIRNAPDFLAGSLFVAIGIVTVVAALDYPLGTIRNIGPGYFPILLGGVLVLLGVAVALKGLERAETPAEGWAVRPLIGVTAAVVVFALLLRPLGLAVATVALVAISTFAGGGFSIVRIIGLSVGLVALSAVIFIHLLGLPFSLWPF
jgi:hypothetical protein